MGNGTDDGRDPASAFSRERLGRATAVSGERCALKPVAAAHRHPARDCIIVQCAANQGLHDPRRRTGSEAIDSSALGPLAS